MLPRHRIFATRPTADSFAAARLTMLARAALLALLGVARASDPSSDVDAYLEAIGVPTGLPLLTVKYPRGGWGHKLTIERTAKVLKAPDDVHMKPVVKWDPENADDLEDCGCGGDLCFPAVGQSCITCRQAYKAHPSQAILEVVV